MVDFYCFGHSVCANRVPLCKWNYIYLPVQHFAGTASAIDAGLYSVGLSFKKFRLSKKQMHLRHSGKKNVSYYTK